jgi:hypothetical protein
LRTNARILAGGRNGTVPRRRVDFKAVARGAWDHIPASAWPRAEIDAWRINRSFSTLEPNPADADPIDEFSLYAIIGTFAEEDVIESTVANAFAQGCDRVFLVDNASPDETVARAAGAGAEVVISFETAIYDERLRWNLVNAWIDHASTTSQSDHVWWLLIDADEFPEAPGYPQLRDFVARLDRRFRVVGARFLNHFPTTPPLSRAGTTPARLPAARSREVQSPPVPTRPQQAFADPMGPHRGSDRRGAGLAPAHRSTAIRRARATVRDPPHPVPPPGRHGGSP